jgi:uncharacterized protein YhjY with autotransporter beta-barrel domain
MAIFTPALSHGFRRVHQMVKRRSHFFNLCCNVWVFFLLLFSAIPLSVYSVPNRQGISRENVKKVLGEQLATFNNKEKREIFEESGIKLTPEILQDQYEKLDDKDTFLKDQLKPLSASDRQDLINSLLDASSYKQLVLNISDEVCKDLEDRANPEYLGVISVIDWLNTANSSSFFQPTMKNTLNNRDSFNDFNSFDQWGIWTELFGFYTNFRRDSQPLQFDLYTLGLSLGGEYTFFDQLVLGLGLAYSYSGLDWQQSKSSASANSIYFGPALSYLFSNGYISSTVFGVVNFYQIKRETNLFPSKIKDPKEAQGSLTSWDFVCRLEGGFFYSAGAHFFLYPTAVIDYLNVFKQASIEQLDKETQLTIESLDESFLRSKIGLKVTREFLNQNIGFLIPYLSMGWISFIPLSTHPYQYQIEGCEHKFSNGVNIKPWNQSYVGVGLSILHKKAILASLGYELTIGYKSPLHAGNLRVELSW